MRQKIKQMLRESDGELKSRFIRSAESLEYIIESLVDTNLITNVEIRNITFDQKYLEVAGDIIITSWCEDPDIIMFTEQVKEVDEEMDKVLLNYSFRNDGTLNKKKGKYNNMMWYMIACNWDIDNNYEMKIKYHFRQEEYDDE
jgi:hypothetical protein